MNNTNNWLLNLLYGSFTLLVTILRGTWNLTSGFIGYLIPWKGSPSLRPPSLLLDNGGRHPRFIDCSYRQALQKCKDEFKFMLVYLHSEIHEDSSRFCSEVLCTEHVCSFLEDNFVFWGANVTSEEGYKVSQDLGATSFPFFAVLVNYAYTSTFHSYLNSLGYNGARLNRSGNSLLLKIQGYVTEDELLQQLSGVLENHGPLIVAARSAREERERERDLIDQQNQAYQESMERDREKEQRREEEERRIQMEHERIQEEERKRIENERKKEFYRQELERRMPPEPEKSDQTAEIAIRLLDGSRVRRRFHCNDSVQLLFDFVASKETSLSPYRIVTHFPKAIISNPNQSIREAKLYPHAALFVEEEFN